MTNVLVILRRIFGTSKLRDRGLELLVRKQLEEVTKRIDAALAEARETCTTKTPDITGQIGDAGLTFEIIGMPIDGIVRATYTGSQAKEYRDILTRRVSDFCRTLVVDTVQERGVEYPTFTAELRLPIKTLMS